MFALGCLNKICVCIVCIFMVFRFYFTSLTLHNNNNNNSHDNVNGAVIMTKVIASVHPVHLMNVERTFSKRLSENIYM